MDAYEKVTSYVYEDEDDRPTCDYCGHGEESADWNPETGNHESCDYQYLIEKAIEQSV